MPRTRRRVFVVGDRVIARLKDLISRQLDMTFAGHTRADDPGKALAAIVAHAPHVVIIDLDGIDLDGSGRLAIGLIRRIRRALPGTAVLVMTANGEKFLAERALSQGARGHVTNDDGDADVLAAIRRLISGNVYVKPDLSQVLLRRLLRAGPGDAIGSPASRLTDRELEVLTLIGEGLRTREIAEELGLSVKTVEAHRGHIRRKLNLRGSQALHVVASRWMLGQECE